MPNRLWNVFVVSISTVGSRILGLARDILLFSTFGSSLVNSAFILAFTFPNLFRRLLGEGALTAAMLPLLAEEKESSGKAALFALFNKILSWLMAVLISLVVLIGLILLLIGALPNLSARWDLAMVLGVLLIPYLALICLAAAFAAILNVLQRFAIPALTAVWLNLAMILFLGGIGLWVTEDVLARMYWLCAGVLFGGCLQLAAPWLALKRQGWKLSPDFQPNPQLRELIRLLLPGIAGASVIQLNIVISRSLAHFIDESAVSVLYLANRLVELPLGVFSIAIATVYFPAFSEWAARKSPGEFNRVLQQALRLIFAITIPAATGLLLLGEPILRFLFEWGSFRAADTALTLPIMWVFALGLPAYSMVAILVRGFYAHKDTQTPMKVACISVGLNVALSLAFMWPLGVIGLALANLLSILVQCLLLTVKLSGLIGANPLGRIWWETAKTVVAALAMALLIVISSRWVESFPLTPKGNAAVDLLALIPIGAICYFSVLWMMRFRELEELKALLFGLIQRHKSRVA